MCYEVVEGVEHERRVRVNAAEPDASMCTADRWRCARGGPRARPRRTGGGGVLCRTRSSVSSSARVLLLVQRPRRRPSAVAPSVVVVALVRRAADGKLGVSLSNEFCPVKCVGTFSPLSTMGSQRRARRAPGPVRPCTAVGGQWAVCSRQESGGTAYNTITC